MNDDPASGALQDVVTIVFTYIQLENVSSRKVDLLKRLGAYERKEAGRTVWRVDYCGEPELAKRLGELAKAGFSFAGGPAGWPPAAVVEHLRSKGLIRGSFLEVTWRGPDDWHVRER